MFASRHPLSVKVWGDDHLVTSRALSIRNPSGSHPEAIRGSWPGVLAQGQGWEGGKKLVCLLVYKSPARYKPHKIVYYKGERAGGR